MRIESRKISNIMNKWDKIWTVSLGMGPSVLNGHGNCTHKKWLWIKQTMTRCILFILFDILYVFFMCVCCLVRLRVASLAGIVFGAKKAYWHWWLVLRAAVLPLAIYVPVKLCGWMWRIKRNIISFIISYYIIHHFVTVDFFPHFTPHGNVGIIYIYMCVRLCVVHVSYALNKQKWEQWMSRAMTKKKRRKTQHQQPAKYRPDGKKSLMSIENETRNKSIGSYSQPLTTTIFPIVLCICTGCFVLFLCFV